LENIWVKKEKIVIEFVWDETELENNWVKKEKIVIEFV
jgi:hypothetical protein